MNKALYPIRQIVRHLFLSGAGKFSKPSNDIHILNGHMITRSKGSGTNKDRQKVRKILTSLKEYGDLTNFEEAVDLISRGEKVSRPKIAFSFDDGFEDCYEHIAPVFEEFGINAMFFINPNFASAADSNDIEYIKRFTENITLSPGKYPMSWTQIANLKKRGFLIGAHTLDHINIANKSQDEVTRQIALCKDIIEAKLETKCDYFAWPYGKLSDTNEKAIEIACSTYKYIFSQSDYKHYFSYGGKVINRRHFEFWWPLSHILYFLSKKKKFDSITF